MSVFKRYAGKKITSKHPKYAEASWWIYRRVRGHKTIHKSVPEAQTKEQAETAERREIEKLFNKRYGVADNTITFNKFVDDKYMSYVRQNNTNVYVKELFVKELKKFFGKILLSDITAQDCRDYQYKRLHTKTKYDTKRSPSSVNKETSTLSKIFTLACQEGVLDRNPMQYVQKLKEPPPRKRLLTDEQKEALFNAIMKDEFLYNIVTLSLNLPVRSGQILAITKDKIDFENRTVKVIASKGREERLLPLNGTALALMKSLADKTSDYLLTYQGQKVKNFGKRWRKVLVDVGINKEDGTREENYHFHDLRTWFTQRLLDKNVHSKTIQGLFAHSSEAVTDIYTNVDPFMVDAVNSLDDNINEVEGVN